MNQNVIARAAATAMFREAQESPVRVRTQLERNGENVRRLAIELKAFAPRSLLTCARGSSDHAATFARYLAETSLGLVTSSLSPSVSSVYGAHRDLSGCLFLAISQSGRSPDLLAAAAQAKSSGALVVALVNDEASPLAGQSHHVVPLHAGPETSVAATKSYICALSAIAHLMARWADNAPLLAALETVPAQLEAAWALDWEPMMERLKAASNMFVLGRGLGLSVAQEAALKFKETCGLHAEAFSGAEVRHGPMALVQKNLPMLIFTQDDETKAGQEKLAAELAAGGVTVLLAGGEAPGAEILPALPSHPAVAPLLLAQSFYRWAPVLAVARGLDPDHPPRLKKITETL